MAEGGSTRAGDVEVGPLAKCGHHDELVGPMGNVAGLGRAWRFQEVQVCQQEQDEGQGSERLSISKCTSLDFILSAFLPTHPPTPHLFVPS